MLKKIVLAVLSTVLVAGGLVPLASATASAAEPYTGTIVTLCDASGQHRIESGRSARSSLYVKPAGNGKPKGAVLVQYIFKSTKKVIKTKNVSYSGRRVTFRSPKLTKRGRYVVRLTFKPGASSVFKGCKDSYSLTVRPRS